MLLKVYHGTNLSSAFDILHHGIDLDKSLPNLDFGKGFYVTDNIEKAIERAFKKTSDYNKRYCCNESACLVEAFIDDELFTGMNTKFFNPREKDWFEFVINNRMDIDYLEKYRIHNHNKDNKFDIVFGEIADGKIARIANDIKKSKYTITDIRKSLILPKNGIFYGNQYSFHTEKSLSCINNISYDTINSIKEERRLIYYEKRCKRIYELCNRNHC